MAATPQAPSDAADLRGRPRQRLLWAYGLGDVGTGMGASLIGFYLLRFYVAAGLPLGWRVWPMDSDGSGMPSMIRSSAG